MYVGTGTKTLRSCSRRARRNSYNSSGFDGVMAPITFCVLGNFNRSHVAKNIALTMAPPEDGGQHGYVAPVKNMQNMYPRPQRARVVLVGSGRMGQIRASILYGNPRFDLCGIVDVDPKAASDLAAKYSTKSFSSLGEAIDVYGSRAADVPQRNGLDGNSPSTTAIDGVVVSSPTFTHEKVITEAAQHGLYIFVEKPVDETAEKIANLFDVCEKTGGVLCCGFQRRFDDSYLATKQAIANGKVGKPVMSTVFFADHPAPPMAFMLTGGNIFMDLLPHDFDYIRWCLEDDVVSVYATGTSSNEQLENAGVHDNATVVMKFKKGAVVTFLLSRSATYGYDQRCEVYGDKGLVCVGNEHASTCVLSDTHGVHSALLKHSFPQRFSQAFSSELDAFADCILDGALWSITAEDCIAVQTVTDAARKSCELNAAVEL